LDILDQLKDLLVDHFHFGLSFQLCWHVSHEKQLWFALLLLVAQIELLQKTVSKKSRFFHYDGGMILDRYPLLLCVFRLPHFSELSHRVYSLLTALVEFILKRRSVFVVVDNLTEFFLISRCARVRNLHLGKSLASLPATFSHTERFLDCTEHLLLEVLGISVDIDEVAQLGASVS